MTFTQLAGMYIGTEQDHYRKAMKELSPKSIFIFGKGKDMKAEIALTDLLSDEYDQELDNALATYQFVLPGTHKDSQLIEEE